MTRNKKVLCVGEILWDALPKGLFLGGAPLNVAYHVNQLGLNGTIASRVGDDRLGQEAIRRIEDKGIDTGLIQRDPAYETGLAEVSLDDSGNAEYHFVEPAAWDHIALTDDLSRCAEKSWAIVFGTLAQRNSKSKNTLHSLLQTDVLKVFDVNFRYPFVHRDKVKESLEATDILKLNEGELEQFIQWFNLPDQDENAIKELAGQFDFDVVAVTYGGGGSVLYRNDTLYRQKSIDVEVKDSVGAGDAFIAALITGIAMKKDNEELLSFANAAGAFTASCSGATPAYNREQIEALV